jgi:hypothetical protein
MSSQQQPIQFSSLSMINRVLARAGYRGTSAEVDANDTSAAAAYLLEKFHEGASSEEELATLLDKRGRSANPADETPAQVKAEALDRWQDEGGAQLPDVPSHHEEQQNALWRGRSISGTISVGAVIFIGPLSSQSAGLVPKPSDRISLKVNGESWSYLVISATDGQLEIQSRAHTLTLVPADAGHPAHGEAVVGIDGASAWIVVTVIGAHS